MARPRLQNGGIAPLLHSFPPVAGQSARILILGSMPGAASLEAGQYYAHPRNQFWPIMGHLAGAHPALPYPERLARLQDAGFALWDVLQSCIRPGSLDSAIRDEAANDLPSFLERYPGITTICFNGRKAQACFESHFPDLKNDISCRFLPLPSTSPAHAALSFEQKLETWKNTRI